MMIRVLRPSSAFATLFGPWFGLVDHRSTWHRSHHSPFLSTGRFSAWFGRLSRRSQLRHKFGPRPAHLLGTRLTQGRFPGSQVCLHVWPRQDQQIVHNSHDLAPAFKLLWSAQPGFDPQQSLLLEAIAMLLSEAPPVVQG